VNLAEAEKLLEASPATAAIAARELLAENPSDAAALRLLGASLRRLGQADEANAAELFAIDASGNDPDLIRASQALKARDYATAEHVLRSVLSARPNDVLAIQTLGEVAAAMGLLNEAEAHHRMAVSLAPGFHYARLHLANVLNDRGKSGEALAELRKIAGPMCEFAGYRMLLADALSKVGQSMEAIALYREFAESNPRNLDVWARLAFLYKAIGQREEAIAASRSAIDAAPASGKAWWALADLKTYEFSEDDNDQLKRALGDPRTADEDRVGLHFALGKALEDREQFEDSFDHYRRGNERRASELKYDPHALTALAERIRTVFTRQFLESHAAAGNPAPDPIFILGMPRSGSTLIEQILASHPLIEGTAELPDIHVLAASIHPDASHGYLDRLASLSDAQLRELGTLYLERTRIQRKTDKPRFLDKMPNNWAHVGFIKLILPNAKIVDVRRQPLACGLSNYKQLFGRGQEFSYDLKHIGAYYRAYVDVMTHFDAVAPGTVHRVVYEQLIEDPDREIRRLLDYVGVPFDEACLRSHESDRPVRTASSEQVRQPLRSDVADHWKAFESELGPLKEALGPALDHWDDPQIP
jgi:tetratricopeptide (TPR) repeat protein